MNRGWMSCGSYVVACFVEVCFVEVCFANHHAVGAVSASTPNGGI